MININSVVLMGRLTKDIELGKTQSNKSVTQFTLAVNRRFKQDGQPEADFIQVVAWNQSADFLAKYANKGTEVSVEGRVQTRSYDKDGQKVYVTEIIAEHVMIGAASVNVAKPQEEPTVSNDDEWQDDYNNPANSPNLDISSDDLPFY